MKLRRERRKKKEWRGLAIDAGKQVERMCDKKTEGNKDAEEGERDRKEIGEEIVKEVPDSTKEIPEKIRKLAQMEEPEIGKIPKKFRDLIQQVIQQGREGRIDINTKGWETRVDGNEKENAEENNSKRRETKEDGNEKENAEENKERKEKNIDNEEKRLCQKYSTGRECEVECKYKHPKTCYKENCYDTNCEGMHIEKRNERTQREHERVQRDQMQRKSTTQV